MGDLDRSGFHQPNTHDPEYALPFSYLNHGTVCKVVANWFCPRIDSCPVYAGRYDQQQKPELTGLALYI